jgi:hypothetical protein
MWQLFPTATLEEGTSPHATTLYDRFHIPTFMNKADLLKEPSGEPQDYCSLLRAR